MATLNFSFNLNNLSNENNSTADGIIVSIPTPEGLEFDTVVTGSGYSDVTKQWSVESLQPYEEANLTLSYTIVTGSSYTLNSEILTAKQEISTQNKSASAFLTNRGVITNVEITDVIYSGGLYLYSAKVTTDTDSQVTFIPPLQVTIDIEDVTASVSKTLTASGASPNGEYTVTAEEGGKWLESIVPKITNVEITNVGEPSFGVYTWSALITTNIGMSCTFVGDEGTSSAYIAKNTPTNFNATFSAPTGYYEVTSDVAETVSGNYNPE